MEVIDIILKVDSAIGIISKLVRLFVGEFGLSESEHKDRLNRAALVMDAARSALGRVKRRVEKRSQEYRKTVLPHMQRLENDVMKLQELVNEVQRMKERYKAERKVEPYMLMDDQHMAGSLQLHLSLIDSEYRNNKNANADKISEMSEKIRINFGLLEGI